MCSVILHIAYLNYVYTTHEHLLLIIPCNPKLSFYNIPNKIYKSSLSFIYSFTFTIFDLDFLYLSFVFLCILFLCYGLFIYAFADTPQDTKQKTNIAIKIYKLI